MLSCRSKPSHFSWHAHPHLYSSKSIVYLFVSIASADCWPYGLVIGHIQCYWRASTTNGLRWAIIIIVTRQIEIIHHSIYHFETKNELTEFLLASDFNFWLIDRYGTRVFSRDEKTKNKCKNRGFGKSIVDLWRRKKTGKNGNEMEKRQQQKNGNEKLTLVACRSSTTCTSATMKNCPKYLC